MMEKGKPLIEDDRKLEISVNDKINWVENNMQQSNLAWKLAEDTDDFLFNVALYCCINKIHCL